MVLSAESYDRLLNWLHSNRVEAEREYQRILQLLMRKFVKQECADPEELAVLTMERVAQTLTPEIVENWDGVKLRYFYRVAYFIVCEDRAKRSKEVQIPDKFEVPQPDEEDSELVASCLEKCLQEQPPDKRELVVRYYRGMTASKIKNRAELARERGLTLPTLRVIASRIRLELKTCIQRCLAEAARQAIFQSKQTLPG